MSGENNPAWVGGYQPYYGPSWTRARRAARERDNYACQECGKTEDQIDSELHVHHIKPFRLFGSKNHRRANSLSNLICLCPNCHSRQKIA
jgi:5-methylcytosine-specific restriction endonuclease McrA